MATAIGEPPIFSGKLGTINIDEFFIKLERWFLTNDTRAARWPGILDANIDYPAKSNYDAAITQGAPPGIQDVPTPPLAAPDADAAAQRAADEARYTAFRNQYTNRRNWLIAAHRGQFEQDRIKEEIPMMQQKLDELPSHFYGRIYKAVEDAGYPEATIKFIARSTFESALHRDIKYHLNMQPRLDTVPMTQQADRIWRNLTGNRTPPKQYFDVEPPRQEIRVEPRPVQATFPPQVQAPPRPMTQRPKELSFEEQLEEMTQKYATLSAHVFGEHRGYGRQYPQQTYGRQGQRQSMPPQQTQFRQQQDPNRFIRKPDVTCWQCGEHGHYSKDCRSESQHHAQPSNASRGIHYLEEWNENEEEEEFYYRDHIAPVQTSERRQTRNRSPYQKEQRTQENTRRNAQRTTVQAPQEELVEIEEDDQMDQTTPEIETTKEQQYRVSKKYDYNLYNAIKELPVPQLTIESFLKMCPPARQQLRKGVTEALPVKEVQSVASITQESDSDDEAKPPPPQQRKRQKKTSAYAQVQIDGTLAEAIVDTGAGSAVISSSFMKRKKWDIDDATEIPYTVANGQKDTTLGIIHDVPVSIFGLTIPIDMIVTNANSYDVILGTE